MLEFSNKINCLSCSLSYVINKRSSEKIEEHSMMLDERTMLINLDSYDTGMDEVLWSWINQNLNYHINTSFIENVPNTILNLPVSYLKVYAEVYSTVGLEETKHFVILENRIDQGYDIYDLFIPTMPISEKKVNISFDETVGIKQLVIDDISGIETLNKKFISENVLSNSKNFWDMLSVRYSNLHQGDAMKEIIKLGESSLYGSRFMLTNYIGYSLFKEWDKLWYLIRINLFKFKLSGNKKYQEKIVELVIKIGKVDIELLEVAYDSYK